MYRGFLPFFILLWKHHVFHGIWTLWPKIPCLQTVSIFASCVKCMKFQEVKFYPLNYSHNSSVMDSQKCLGFEAYKTAAEECSQLAEKTALQRGHCNLLQAYRMPVTQKPGCLGEVSLEETLDLSDSSEQTVHCRKSGIAVKCLSSVLNEKHCVFYF